MNCKKGWDEKFLVEKLNRSFCNNEYKVYRKELLIDREMSKLPETMHLAERQKRVEVEEKKITEITNKIKILNAEANALLATRHQVSLDIQHIKQGSDENGKAPDRRKFIMACPNENCRGYLSTQYKCELCELFTCPHCIELIGYSKTEPHECNADSVATAEMIKKETKPCPSCGIRIFKISGCNQMWCTECKVAFNYNTGQIDTGVVHNPHYYTHIAQQNGGQTPRNPRDVLCGGLLDISSLYRGVFKKLQQAIADKNEYQVLILYIGDLHRVISHITYVELARCRTAVRELENNTNLRVQYILGKTSKQEIGDQVYRQDLKRKRETELIHLFELLSVVGIENFGSIYDIHKKVTPENLLGEINKKILLLNNLREYCNKEFAKISVTYNRKTMYITDTWKIKNQKWKISDLKTWIIPSYKKWDISDIKADNVSN
jgi:hypothetical protein